MDFLTEKECTAFFVLLRAGLWEHELEGLSRFPLDRDEWKRVFTMARCQTVTGLVYRGICRLPDKYLPPENILLKWVSTVDMIERRNKAMNNTIAGFVEHFSEYGADVVLQKGQGVATYYEKPLLRECGDIDFYFRRWKDSRNFVEKLERKGIDIKYMSDGGLYYRWNGIIVEHHRRLFDICNPFSARFLSRQIYRQGLDKMVLDCGKSTFEVSVPTPLLNLFLLNAHIMKHAVGWGIGLKQLCDMARACYKLHDKVRPEEMDKLVKRTALERWSRLLYSFLAEYLGLPADCIPSVNFTKQSARSLFDIVMAGGNMGQHVANRNIYAGKGWKSKLNTSSSFFNNISFTLRYAPGETFWYFTNLLAGQMKR